MDAFSLLVRSWTLRAFMRSHRVNKELKRVLRALWTSWRWAECRGLRVVHCSVETRFVLRPSLRRSILSVSSLFLSLNFLSSLVSSFWTLLFRRASNSAASCLVDHVFCRRCRGDVFKLPSRRELSAFVGKLIETISVSLLSHSRHYFGIDESRWLTSQFFKRRATILSTWYLGNEAVQRFFTAKDRSVRECARMSMGLMLLD